MDRTKTEVILELPPGLEEHVTDEIKDAIGEALSATVKTRPFNKQPPHFGFDCEENGKRRIGIILKIYDMLMSWHLWSGRYPTRFEFEKLFPQLVVDLHRQRMSLPGIGNYTNNIVDVYYLNEQNKGKK